MSTQYVSDTNSEEPSKRTREACLRKPRRKRLIMRVLKDQAEFLYERIQNDVRVGHHRLLILVAQGVDALCACRMLTMLFLADSIPYQIHPVSGYRDVIKAVDDFVTDKEGPASVILINCGANVNLTQQLDLLHPSRSELVIYIIDSHRPLDLVNVADRTQRVRVLTSDDDVKVAYPEELDEEAYREMEEGENGDDEDGWEEEWGGDEGEEGIDVDEEEYDDDDEVGEEEEEEAEREEEEQVERKSRGAWEDDDVDGEEGEEGQGEGEGDDRRRRRRIALDDDEEQGNEGEEGGLESSLKAKAKASKKGKGEDNEKKSAGKKRKRKTQGKERGEKRHRPSFEEMEEKRRRIAVYRQMHNKLRAYYQVEWFASPIALTMFEMAIQLGRETNELLWMAILGLTDQWLTERISHENYANAIPFLCEHVNKLNDSQPSNTPLAQRRENDELTHIVKQGHIVYSEEYKFPMLRHWTLYDSMFHSRHVAASLKLWTDKGLGDFKTVLAKMAIPLVEAQSPYSIMAEDLKNQLRSNLAALGPLMGLEDNTFESFYRHHSTKFIISAADTVLALTAILEATPGSLSLSPADDYEAKQRHLAQNASSSTSSSPSASSSSSPSPSPSSGMSLAKDIDPHELYKPSKRYFWAAYDALDVKATDILSQGISQMLTMTRCVVNQGMAMIKKGEVDTRSYFHHATIDASADIQFFQQPMALIRLAFFLQDFIAMQKTPRPLVLAVLQESAAEYLVVGVNQIRGETTRQGPNSFGAAFTEAAIRINARIRQEGFDTTVMQVQRDDLKAFLKQMLIVVTTSVALNLKPPSITYDQ